MKLQRLISALLIGLAGLAGFARGEEVKWVEAQSSHFLLFTDASEAKGRRLLEDFEGRVAALTNVIGTIPDRQFPIEIFLLDKGPDFTEVTGLEPDKSAYLFRGPDRIFIVARDKSPDDIANDVGHALGHVFFERTTLWRPFWLAEGSAEYFRKAGRKPDTKSVIKEESFSARDLLRIVPTIGYRDGDPGGASRTQSHRLLHLLADRHRDALTKFLEAIRQESGEKARVDVDALDQELTMYAETPIPLAPRPDGIRTRTLTADQMAIHRGDLLVAAGKYSPAAERYSGSDTEARAARAVLIRFTRNAVEAARALERSARELPEASLVQLHFGSLEITSPPDLIAAQAVSLERAVQAFPLSGRAAAELARVYTLDGRAQKALPLIDKALALEPEFSDRFYDIRAQAFAALKRFDDAYRTMKMSAALPHVGEKTDALYEQKVKTMSERAETFRREADAQRVDQIRKDVDRAADLLDPPPPPPAPPPPPRQSSMGYSIEAEKEITVVNRFFPEFPAVLLQNGMGGEIVFDITVDPNGRVTRIEVQKSQLPDFDASTLSLLRRWTFKPVEVDGQSASFKMILTFRYEVEQVNALPGVR